MNGLHELPLVIFTVLAQSAVGIWLIFNIILFQHSSAQNRHYLHKIMLIPLIMLGIGFIASIYHLGSPFRAFNSLNRIGHSMLSNEIATGAAFFMLAGLYWLLAMSNKIAQTVLNVLLLVSSFVGLIFMSMMASVYLIPTVPTWYSPTTFCSFFITLLLGGCAISYFLLHTAPLKLNSGFIPWLFAFSVAGAIVLNVYQAVELAQIHSAIQQAYQLEPHYAMFSILRLIGLIVATVILFKSQRFFPLGGAVLLIIAAEIIGRILFYGLHMTLGMAIGG